MGTVVEVMDLDQHVVKVDGSGRVTKRNRRFLRKIPDGRVAPATIISNTTPPHVPVFPTSIHPAASSSDTPASSYPPNPDGLPPCPESPSGIHHLLI